MTEPSRSAFNSRRSSLPSPKKCCWPANSASFVGRIRAANGSAPRRLAASLASNSDIALLEQVSGECSIRRPDEPSLNRSAAADTMERSPAAGLVTSNRTQEFTPAELCWRTPLSTAGWKLWRVASLAGLLIAIAASLSAAEQDLRPMAEGLEFFEKRVRPLLVSQCQKCHGAKEQKGGLRLDSRAAALAGGDSGPAVVPGKIDQGLLLDAVAYGDLYQMPPSGKLPAADWETFRRWIELGAPWPAESAAAAAKKPSEFDLAERAKHWAFQGWIDHEPPAVRDAAWPASPVDQFILSRLEA